MNLSFDFCWRFCVVRLLCGFFSGCRCFCHRTESDLFLFLLMDNDFRLCASCDAFHTSPVLYSLREFFDDEDNWNEENVKVGECIILFHFTVRAQLQSVEEMEPIFVE